MRKNIYLIAGGHGDGNVAFLRRAIAETGKENPTVAYVGTASGDSMGFMRNYFVPMLKEAGAAKVSMVHLVGTDHGSEKARRLLIDSDIVFVSGGEVEDGIAGIPNDVKVLLRQLCDMGKVFVTLSAGTIMLGIAWPHWDDEEHDPENATLFPCLGFVSAIFDTHSEDEDWVELRKAVALSPEGFVGYGLPSGSQVIVSPDGALHPTMSLDAFRCEDGKAVYLGKFNG